MPASPALVRSPRLAIALGRAVSLTVLLSAAVPGSAHATGQCSPYEAEKYDGHPDYLPPYAAGTLGVVSPQFARSYLVVAYLYLTGARLDEPLQQQVRALWDRRSNFTDEIVDLEKPWLDARAAVPGLKPGAMLSGYRHEWVNCLPDSFRAAARTLARLRGQPGVTTAAVRSWVEAQDLVFQNCSAEANQPLLPMPLPDTAPPALRAERDYQIAAAHFYSGGYPEAARRFAAIAKDPASPWASLGVYLQARAHLRRALVEGEADGLATAQTLLEGLARQPVSSFSQVQAERLLGLVLFRRAPAPYLRQVVAELRQSGPNYAVRLGDYLIALDAMTQYSGPNDPPQSGPTAKDLPSLRAEDELTDWVLSFQGRLPGGREAQPASSTEEKKELIDYLLGRYDKKRAVPWLLAALAWVPADHPRLAELLGEAQKLPKGSPGRDTATYYTLRLLEQSPGAAGARTFADRLAAELKARQDDPPSTLRNQLLSWAFARARTLDDAVKYGVRFVLGNVDCSYLNADAEGQPPRATAAPQHLSQPLAALLAKQVPLLRLATLLEHPSLPASVRAQLRNLLYARGLLLGESEPTARALAERLEPLLSKDHPQLASPLKALHEAPTPQARHLAIGMLFLQDTAPSAWAITGTNYSWDSDAEKDRPEPAVVPAAERAAAAQEQKQLTAFSSPVGVAARFAIEYGTLHPDDPRLPQLLLDINRKSRYAHDTQWSKKAFLFMHKTYPSHPLTRQVKYWY